MRSAAVQSRTIRILIAIALPLTGTLRAQEVECAPIPDTTSIQILGAFSDMRYTEEHAYGQTVELWRTGKCIFGFLEVAAGLAGDTPTGVLIQVRHNSGTGDLAFTAKLTTGLTYAVNAKEWVPSRDFFVFGGRLSGGMLKGKLRLRSTQAGSAAGGARSGAPSFKGRPGVDERRGYLRGVARTGAVDSPRPGA